MSKEILITGSLSITELADYSRYDAALPENVGKAPALSTIDGVEYVVAPDTDIRVSGAGAQLVGVSQRFTFQGTGSLIVESGGFFEDANGAVWEDAGTVYKASHVYFQIKDTDSSLPIEGAVVGFGDETTQTRLLYSTSLALDTLVTDVDGKADGYFVYDIGGTTFDNMKQVSGEYYHVYSTIPRSLDGKSIGTAESPEVIRMPVDNQVTRSKVDAGLVVGVSVDIPTATIDMGDNALEDVYDFLKLQLTTDVEINPGVPGCMFFCLYGLPLVRQNNAFVGMSGWKYMNMDGSLGSFTGGIFAVDAGEVFTTTITSTTMEFLDPGSYDFRGNTFNGTIEVTNTSGGVVDLKLPVGVDVVNTGPDIDLEQSITVRVELPNLLDGTMVWVADTTNGLGLGQPVEMHYEVVSGGAGYVHDFEFSSNFPIRIEATYVDGMVAKEPIIVNATLTSGGYYSDITQVDDEIYNRIAAELNTTGEAQDSTNGGSFTADLINIQIDVNDADNTLDARLGILWYYWKCTTVDGIRVYSPDALAPTPDEFNIVVNGPLQLENVKETTRLTIINGNWVRADGGNMIAPTSHTVHWQGYLQAFTGDIQIQGDVLIDENAIHGALDSYSNKDDYKADLSGVSASVAPGDIHAALDSYGNKDDYKADLSGVSASVAPGDIHAALDSYVNKDDYKADMSAHAPFTVNDLHTGLTSYAGKDLFKADVSGLSTMGTADIHSALDSYANKQTWQPDVSNLDVPVSTRLAAATYEGKNSAAEIHTALDTYVNKDDYKANVSNLDAPVSSRLPTTSYQGKNTADDIHDALDSYNNKDDYKADVTNLDVPVSTRLSEAAYAPITANDVAEAVWNYDLTLVVDDDTAAQILKEAKQNALNAFAVSV